MTDGCIAALHLLQPHLLACSLTALACDSKLWSAEAGPWSSWHLLAYGSVHAVGHLMIALHLELGFGPAGARQPQTYQCLVRLLSWEPRRVEQAAQLRAACGLDPAGQHASQNLSWLLCHLAVDSWMLLRAFLC